jgi:hypothetical protein
MNLLAQRNLENTEDGPRWHYRLLLKYLMDFDERNI